MVEEDSVLSALAAVIDPELDVDIVSMGFIYNVEIEQDQVKIAMTLTTRGCPMHSTLKKQAEDTVKNLDGVTDAQVDIVFDPPWNTDMMSTFVREKLGISS
ncbi:aromatic ring hydroxylase [candidate division LCP-89 bacterium B3_LCP]|uniref:Aromatic ring hydroxylase n=1 Tax=candidate division LCP-89 bacterium B3_LCP TaxID=2012998 RepID=A0A532UVS0_UNCL8|nr:MAG: aromatic ring hydroxylase [candidate division LCP-89 bacterium B3_LCP]